MKTYEFNLKPYCENCPEFEVDISTSSWAKDPKTGCENFIGKLRLVGCKHSIRCEKMINYLSKENIKEN